MRRLLPLHLTAAVAMVTVMACGGSTASNADTADDTAPMDVAEDVDDALEDAADDTTPPDDTADDTADVATDAVVPDDTGDATPDDMTEPDGSDTVEPPKACAEHGDCNRCAYPTAPVTLEDCYCVLCPSTPMDVTTCDANREAWQTVCGDTQWTPEGGPCPIPRCLQPAPVACMGGACVDACQSANCPDLPCPANEQVTPSGECCPRCTGAGTCQSDDACALCFYPNEPASGEECQCPICPVHPMTTERCTANAAAFDTHCGQEFQSTCPVAICLPQPPPSCGATGYCERSPYRCDEAEDCVYCRFDSAPTDASDCACPGCGAPMTREECDAIEGVVAEVCDGFAFDDCVPNACAEPPPLACDFGAGLCTMQWETPASP
jgi:hypothetical protein